MLPAFDVCGEMMDILLETRTSQAAGELGLEGCGGKERAWVAPLADNRRRWKEQCQPVAKGMFLVSVALPSTDQTLCKQGSSGKSNLDYWDLLLESRAISNRNMFSPVLLALNGIQTRPLI